MTLPEEIAYLLDRFLADELTVHQRRRIRRLALDGRNHAAFAEAIELVLKQNRYAYNEALNEDEIFDNILRVAENSAATSPSLSQPKSISQTGRAIGAFRAGWWRYAAAAVIILGTGGYVWLKSLESKPVPGSPTEEKGGVAANNSNDKAVLKLADGSTIVLDEASNGTLAKEGNSVIVKLNSGQLAYNSEGGEQEAVYNTMSTPRGGQYSLVLQDGSKVWLNAASSIRFPSAFTDKERVVRVTGEAYFEVRPLLSKDGRTNIPFIVEVNTPDRDGCRIEVLGTRFNVHAYTDEPVIKTTLLQGAVNIRKGSQSSLLSPGQQARLSLSGEITMLENANLEEAIAWKNGFFQFESAGLADVLKTAARWYDLDIAFEGEVPSDKFTGRIERSISLSRFLKWLQWSDIKLRQEGKKIIVLQ